MVRRLLPAPGFVSGGSSRLAAILLLFALSLCAVLVLAACNLPATALPPATAAPPQPTGTFAPPPASDTPAAPPSTATPTAVPATPSPTQNTPSLPPPVTAENAARLAFQPLTLPEYPARLLWVGPGASLPAAFQPAPDFIIVSGTNLYPLRLQPAQVGQPAALAVPERILAFAPDASSVAASPAAGQVELYNLAGTLLKTLPEPSPYGASYSPDGRLLAVTSQSEFAASLYDATSGQRTARLTGFETAAPVYGVDIVPGGKLIVWHVRATFDLQDVATGQFVQKLSYQDFIGDFAFSPDGTRMVIYVEGKLLLYTVPEAKKLAELSLSRPASSLVFSPDGRLLAAGYEGGLQIWDAASLAPIAALPGPNTFTGQVLFSPDGRYLVSTHDQNVVAVWSVGK